MPLQKVSLKTGPQDQGKRLDQFLAEKLPDALARPISKAKARKLIVAGAVYLNGTRVRIASKELRVGARVEAFVDLSRLESDATAKDIPFEMSASQILHEDEFLIVVDKPAGLPTQPTLDEARINLFSAVKKFLSSRDGKPDPYLALHHRLDRDTSGVILFAKDKRANAGVSELFSQHIARKVYQALTLLPGGATKLEPRWTIKNYLAKAPGSGKRARFTAVRSGGDFAETEVEVLARLKGGLHVEARPKTGRTHQIRVHLSEAGLPILGDSLYGAGAAAEKAPRVMLHAVSLTFPHPIHKTEITVKSPLPEDFTQCLALLR
jgi:23S rRNA pseudouridine1911/1915/1917 synthase